MTIVVLGVLFLLVAIPFAIYLGLYRVIQPTGVAASKRHAIEPVSVVLPTYNEADIVEDKLRDLCSLSYPASKLEIVVVDSSTDETAEIVRSFFDERTNAMDEDAEVGDDEDSRSKDRDDAVPSLSLIEEEERGGVASAVNLALEAASHDVIFRTDCDSKLEEDAIEHAVATLQDPSVGGVTGRQLEVLGDSKLEAEYRSIQARNQALESHLDSTFIVHGPCFAFRKEYFQPISPDSLADDTEIAVNIRKQGKRIVMDPAMVFAEAGVSNVRARRKRKDRRAMGLIQLLIRHRELLGRYGNYGRIVVPFNWWFLVVSPWLTMAFLGLFFLTLFFTLGLLGVAGPMALVAFVLLGGRDLLGPLQPFYAVLDSQFSLVIATIRLLREEGDGTWEVDSDSREVFDGESRR